MRGVWLYIWSFLLGYNLYWVLKDASILSTIVVVVCAFALGVEFKLRTDNREQ
jgi:hypothetical protein